MKEQPISDPKGLTHQFLVVEGNIGAGKTTLARRLSEDYGSRLILEEFSDNPFLPYFYENPERYAFPVELFFMTERHKQLQNELAQIQLFNQGVVSDYYFFKTLLFAKNNLKPEEYRLFQRLFNILRTHFPQPDLLVYLHRPVDDLMSNIRKRGRSYEQNMEARYLGSIQQAYFEFFKANTRLPVLLLELGDLDFVANDEQYLRIRDLIAEKYEPGLHRITLASSTA